MEKLLSDGLAIGASVIGLAIFAISFLGAFLGRRAAAKSRRATDTIDVKEALQRQIRAQLDLIGSDEGEQILDSLILVEAALFNHIETRIDALAELTDEQIDIRLGFVRDRYGPTRGEEIIAGVKRALRGALPELKKKLVELINDVVKSVVTGPTGTK